MPPSTLNDRLKELIGSLDTVHKQVKKHRAELAGDHGAKPTNTTDGISLLEAKYHLLLEYLTDVAYFVDLKLRGTSTVDHPVIQHLIENRVYLEKLRPVEAKLKYQIDKVVRAASLENPAKIYAEVQAKAAEADPLQFKPNMASMKAVNENITRVSTDGGKEGDGLYKAPKVAPAHFEEEASAAAKRKRFEERIRQKAMQTEIVRDLVSEFDNRPQEEEVHGNVGIGGSDAYKRKRAERERYEEDNFKRMDISRKDKHQEKVSTFQSLDHEFKDLNDFASRAAIYTITKGKGNGHKDAADMLEGIKDGKSSGKRRKTSSKKSYGKKFRK
ncbi:hypothetical protein IWQ60_005338 [Tieghemiomyces parasiticus]|uniref:Uncharacterized protein n=1 Tax=Tieghemiomyces parasiticus TaxID=78921 RepID=A0A9W8DUQ0_9FUNG|nr:hypothetical protein IWQ60_005338 [Tieghemiomyces parasiticus]